MRAAVTGGSGVVGRALLRHLVEGGHEVRALARSDESRRQVRELGAEPVAGDVLDREHVEALVAGADTVFHLAGVNELCPSDPAAMWRVNVEGTEVVLAACRRREVGRLVHTSSASTIGEARGTVADEATPRRRPPLSEYERSKAEAELVVTEGRGELDVVVVNPASVQGPGRVGGTGALLAAAAGGRLPVLVDTVFSIVDIDDCARGHILAAEKGGVGERYIFSGGTLTVREAVSILARITGRRRPWFVHPGLATVAAHLVGPVMGRLGRRPLLCPESARVLLHGHRYDGSKATRELGLDYTPVEDTFRRTVDWVLATGAA